MNLSFAATIAAALACIALAVLPLWRGRGLTLAQRVSLTVLRAGALAGCALMALDPTSLTTRTEAAKGNAVVLADTSRSMSLEGAQGTRLEEAQAAVQALRDQLAPVARVRVLQFADDGATPVAGDAVEIAKTAAGTDIGQALASVAEQTSGVPLDAVVLVSDGADTTGADADAIVAPLLARGIPTYAVGCGRDARPPGAGLARVTHPDVVRANTAFSVSASLYSHDLTDTAELTLQEDGAAPQRQAVKLPVSGPVAYNLRAGQPGVHRYTVALSPTKEGAWPVSRNAFAIRVLPEKPSLLVIGGRPGPDYAALRRHLGARQDMKLTFALRKSPPHGFWLDEQTPSPLSSLDGPLQQRDLAGVLLVDVEPEALTGGQLDLLRRIVETSGGLGIAGGNGTMLDAPTLSALLPVGRGRGYTETPCRPEIGDKSSPLARDLALAGSWGAVPFMSGYVASGAAKPGAAVILRARSVSGDLGPLLSVRTAGRGRTLVFGGIGVSRWKSSADATDNSRRQYDLLWDRIADWLTTPRNDTPVSVVTDRDAYVPGATVRVIVYATDAGLKPLVGAQVSVYLDDKASVAAVANPTGEPGRYEAAVAAPAEGTHRLRAVVARGGSKLGEATATFTVAASPLEMRDTGRDTPMLRRIAELTGGQYADAADAAALASQIRFAPRPTEALRVVHRARGVAALLLLLALCAIDWSLRRRWGLA